MAALLDINIRTVRKWAREGLAPLDRRAPFLFLGEHVAAFLRGKNKPRCPLAPGEVYCAACKAPVMPAGLVVDVVLRSATTADFVADCPQCGRRTHRRVTLSEVGVKAGPLLVRYEDGKIPIDSSGKPVRTALFEESAT